MSVSSWLFMSVFSCFAFQKHSDAQNGIRNLQTIRRFNNHKVILSLTSDDFALSPPSDSVRVGPSFLFPTYRRKKRRLFLVRNERHSLCLKLRRQLCRKRGNAWRGDAQCPPHTCTQHWIPRCGRPSTQAPKPQVVSEASLQKPDEALSSWMSAAALD